MTNNSTIKKIRIKRIESRLSKEGLNEETRAELDGKLAFLKNQTTSQPNATGMTKRLARLDSKLAEETASPSLENLAQHEVRVEQRLVQTVPAENAGGGKRLGISRRLAKNERKFEDNNAQRAKLEQRKAHLETQLAGRSNKNAAAAEHQVLPGSYVPGFNIPTALVDGNNRESSVSTEEASPAWKQALPGSYVPGFNIPTALVDGNNRESSASTEEVGPDWKQALPGSYVRGFNIPTVLVDDNNRESSVSTEEPSPAWKQALPGSYVRGFNIPTVLVNDNNRESSVSTEEPSPARKQALPGSYVPGFNIPTALVDGKNRESSADTEEPSPALKQALPGSYVRGFDIPIKLRSEDI